MRRLSRSCTANPLLPRKPISRVLSSPTSLLPNLVADSEVLPPPSPPQPRTSLPSRAHGERSNSDRTSRRLQHAESSPFANFGRFGVDGGLSGELEGAGARNRRTRGLAGAGTVGSAAAAAANGEVDKDAAPHLLGRDRSGAAALHSERERGERLRARGEREDGGRSGGLTGEADSNRRRGGAGSSSLDALEGQTKRDTRRGNGPADEGGWRNVGMTREGKSTLRRGLTEARSSVSNLSARTEREKRLGRNHSGSTADSPSSRREGGAFGARSGRPAWMDDESTSGQGGGASPAWMDAPATGKMSFDSDGHARDILEEERRDKRGPSSGKAAARELETYNPAASGGGANGGMDSMQMFKAQMKERERRERERDLRARGLPIESDEPAPREGDSALAPAPSKSILDDLGIARAPPGLGSPSPAAREVDSAVADSSRAAGRSSRFAKFFDGKPAPQPAPAASSPADAASPGAASIFGSLMGGAGASSHGGESPAPSKEDADSMARLLGMLQVSGQRTASPNSTMKGGSGSASPNPLAALQGAASPANVGSPSLSPAPGASKSQSSRSGGEDGQRSRSRFNFSSQAATPSPGAPAQPVAPSLQSPYAAAASLPPAPSVLSPPPGLASPMSSHAPAATDGPSSPAGSVQSSRRGRPDQPPGLSPPQSMPNELQHSLSPPPPPGFPPQQQAKQQPQPPFYGHGPSAPFPPGPGIGLDGRPFPPHLPLPGGPGQPGLPPNMPPPPFAFGPDGRPMPLPFPPPPFASGGPGGPPKGMPFRGNAPFGSPLSPPLASPPNGTSPGGMRGQPAQFPFPPSPMPGLQGPMQPPPQMFPPPHFAPGRMPLPPPNPNQGPPPPMFNLGGNAGADLMALLNSGSGGQRIGADGPPNGVQVRQG